MLKKENRVLEPSSVRSVCFFFKTSYVFYSFTTKTACPHKIGFLFCTDGGSKAIISARGEFDALKGLGLFLLLFFSHNMCKCWNKVLISPIQYKTRLGCRVKTLLLPGSQNILNYRLLQGRVLYNIPSAWYSWIYGLREAVFLCILLLFPAVLLAEQSLLIWRKMKGWLLLIDINKWKGREGWGEAV